MVIWLIFHILIFILLLCYKSAKSNLRKTFYANVVIFFLVYFSAFRDGLGTDYVQYVKRLDVYNSLESLVIGFSEPLFCLIGFIVDNTFFSPILLFLLCAIVTNAGIAKFYFKFKDVAIAAVLIYIFLPTLYGMTFNIVRQFFSVGLFFFSLSYLEKSPIKYSITILIATLMHMSAIVLLPLYWVLNYDIKRKYVIPLAIVVGLISIAGIALISGGDFKYSEMASSTDAMAASGMIILYNLFFVYTLINKKLYYGMPLIVKNLFVLYIVLVDASFANYFFYRLSYYFFPVIALVIPYCLKKINLNGIALMVFISLLVILNYYIILSNLDDELIVPSRILPIESLFDSQYEG